MKWRMGSFPRSLTTPHRRHPFGTGNDFFRMVVPPQGPRIALDVALTWNVEFDVGRVRFGDKESVFVNLLGVGVDVEVLRKRADFTRLGGLTQYLAALGLGSFDLPAGFRYRWISRTRR